MRIGKKLKLEMYYKMNLVRRFEERAIVLSKNGRLPGWLHACLGQEGSASGACFALKENDYIVASHRGHGQCIVKGMDLKKLMGELYGKETGCCKGRAGSMHPADRSKGIVSAVGGLGGGVPYGAGVAMSFKLRKTDQVLVAFFGEGASNEGVVPETMNMAALWDLPIIFFCETNQYAELSRTESHLKIDTVAKRAQGFGMPGVTVDGNDVLAVYDVTSKAIKRAREGKGPTLIDSITCRWEGHYIGDPMVYRKEGELEKWKKKDPILKLEKSLFKDGILDEDGKQKMIEKIDQAIAEAEEFAENSAYPKPEEALEGVYC